MYTRSLLLTALLATTMSVPRTVPGQILAGPASGVDAAAAAEVNLRLSLWRSDLVVLDIDTTPGKALTAAIDLPAQRWTLDLQPYSVRGENFRLFERREGGQLFELKPGVENTLRGTVREEDGAIVAGGVMADGFYATILFLDGRQAWIEPVSELVKGIPAGTHVVYFSGDELPSGAVCRTPDLAPPGLDPHHAPVTGDVGAATDAGEQAGGGTGGGNGGGGQPRGGTRYGAGLGLEADFTYYELFGSVNVTSQRMHLIVNMMNLHYERDVDIYHYVTLLVVDTVLLYDRNLITEGFRDRWNTEFAGIEHDLAMIIVGVGGGGYALPTGRTCNGNGQAYCVTQMGPVGAGIDPTWPGSYPGLSYCCDVSAHELGHLWGACHCTCTSPAYTMNPVVTNANRFGFTSDECATNSIARIIATRNNASCLVTTGGGFTVRNDLCANALLVEVEPNGIGTYGVSNSGCTRDGPLGSCRAGDSDVWFRYIAPCPGTLTIDTCETNFDSVLIAYGTGDCGNLSPATEVGCNDDVPGCFGGLSSSISFNTNAGAHYLIRLCGYAINQGSTLLRLTHNPCYPVSNDRCTWFDPIRNGQTITFSTIGADTDGWIEPLCNNAGDQQVASDIWYRYVPPCTGNVLVTLCGSSFDTKLAVYQTVCPSAPGNAFRCNDDNGPDCVGLASSLIFPVFTPNLPHFIRVGGYEGATGAGQIRVVSLSCPLPPNDECTEATEVPVGTYVGNLTGGYPDGDATCGLTSASRDVYYRFTAPRDGILTANTCGTHDAAGLDTGMDTVLSVHRFCPAWGGSEVDCDDDSSGCLLDSGVIRDSRLVLPMPASESWLIRVAHYNTSIANGAYTLTLSFAPLNDDCAAAVSVGDGSTPVHNLGATTDGPAEPASCNFFGDPQITADVWYRYTASCTGTATINLCTVAYDTELAVYPNSCPSAGGTVIACNDDACAFGSQVSFPTVNGTAYLVRVGGYQGFQGTATMTISCAGAPDEPADWNNDGMINSQDYFDFLIAFFANSADFNNDGVTNSQDYFDFLTCFFNPGNC
jgi:hypothetical protein